MRVQGVVRFFNGETALIKSEEGELLYADSRSIRRTSRPHLRVGGEVQFVVRRGADILWHGRRLKWACDVCHLVSLELPDSQRPSCSIAKRERDGVSRYPNCAVPDIPNAQARQAPQCGKRPKSPSAKPRRRTGTRTSQPTQTPCCVKPRSLPERTELARILLLQAGHLPSSVGEKSSPFVEAVKAGNIARVFHLLSAGKDPNTRDGDSSTVLARAVAADNTLMVDLLIVFGADASLVNTNGVSALTLAFEHSKYFHLRNRLLKAERTGDPSQIQMRKKPLRLHKADAPSQSCTSASKPARGTTPKQSTEEARFKQDSSDLMDGSKGWGWSFRDNGAFGSFPGFDDYGDESSA